MARSKKLMNHQIPDPLVLNELENAENEWRNYRQRQWDGVKYFTSLLSALISVLVGAEVASLTQLDKIDGYAILPKLIFIVVALFAIIIPVFAIRNFHRETQHLFESISSTLAIRKHEGLLDAGALGGCYPSFIVDLKELKSPEYNDFEAQRDLDKWVLDKSSLLLRPKTKEEPKTARKYTGLWSVAKAFLPIMTEHGRATFLGLIDCVFFFLQCVAFMILILTILFYPPGLLVSTGAATLDPFQVFSATLLLAFASVLVFMR